MMQVVVEPCPNGCLRMTFVGTQTVVAVVRNEEASPVKVTFQR